MFKAALAALLLVSVAAPASAAIYNDCARAPTTFATTWHIDPVNGKSPADGGDGSAAHPWNSLQGVLAYNYQVRPVGWTKAMLSTYPYDHAGIGTGRAPNGQRYAADGPGFDMTQIQPGDKVLLASGNYGSIGAGSPDGPVSNVDSMGATKWVTFAPEPGATPVIQTLSISGVRGEMFNGVTIRSIIGDGSAFNGGNLVQVSDGGPTMPTMDIVVANNYIGSAATMPTKINPDGSYLSGWTKADWTKARNGVRVAGSDDISTKCVTIGNNVVKYIGSGIAVAHANETVISQNLIDYFTGDAMDNYSNSVAVWQANVAEDRVDDGNGTHTDCLQLAFSTSDTSTLANPWHDIVITRNQCLRLVHSDNPFPGYMQGIFRSNGFYSHLTVTDNKIVTAACIGMNFNVTDSVIANNTIVRDGTPGSFSPGCNGLAMSVGSPVEAGDPHNLAANNVVTGAIAQDHNGTIWLNNASVPSVQGGIVGGGGASYLWNGTAMVFVSSGPPMNGVSFYNYLTDTSTVFTAYNPPSTGFSNPNSPNLTPAVGGVLAGTGYSGVGIPTTNIWNGAFPTPTNIGAY